MNNLLDTHTLLWYLEGSSHLSSTAKKYIEKKDSHNFVSIATLWELAIKISLGKLEIFTTFSEFCALVEDNGFNILPVLVEDTITISSLPFHHRDPFDRLIISQAMNKNLLLLSKDEVFKEYRVKIAW